MSFLCVLKNILKNTLCLTWKHFWNDCFHNIETSLFKENGRLLCNTEEKILCILCSELVDSNYWFRRYYLIWHKLFNETLANEAILYTGLFRPVLFSPFYTCNHFRPVFNSPRHSSAQTGIIWDIGIRLVLD